MYRLSVFFIAVAVLVGLVLSGGFQSFSGKQQAGSDSVAAMIAQSERELQLKADQELEEIDARAGQGGNVTAALALPELKKPLTQEDIELAAKRAGEDAKKTALRVGQSEQQALQAQTAAEAVVRRRLERQMMSEMQGT
ncbi:hypothetical protein [Pseudochrobactrum sp. HB0163]|uniref:hypothetical protein n=1 Tax=Pseudochrobactrum sp. HB0163 TaxID=3450708 RepID=UPI003F6E0FBF